MQNFILAIPIGMIAYTGIETISNMAEEAKDERRTIPEAINRVRLAVYAIYFTLPAVALSALPVQRDPQTGEYYTLLGAPRTRAATPATRSWAWSSRSIWDRCSLRASSMSACSPRPSCSSPPTRR
jgi:amino acid transporter